MKSKLEKIKEVIRELLGSISVEELVDNEELKEKIQKLHNILISEMAEV